MLQNILEWDKELFLYLNSKHSFWLDPIMLFLSSSYTWTIGMVVMLALLYIKSDTKKKTVCLFFMLSVSLSALITNLIKVIIERPRPIHNDAWQDIIHAIEKYESSYSFFSSHSATTFCMAVFFFLFFRNTHKWYGYIALLWAALVAYSRIYLAKHYPFDVLCGILFGSIIGLLGYYLYVKYKEKKEKSGGEL